MVSDLKNNLSALNPWDWVWYIILLAIIIGIILLVIVVFPLIFRVLLRSVATMRQNILELQQKYKNERECYAHSSEVCLAGQEAWKHSRGKEFHGNSPPGALAFSLTRILIPYSRVSLVYGSTCSLLVLFYYKCLLRLNSDIAKPSPVFQCPRKTLKPTNLEFSRNSVRMLPIQ